MDGNFIQGLILVIVTAGLGGVGLIYKQLSTLNGSVREIKIWILGHDKQDDDRHKEIKVDLTELWDQLSQVKKRGEV